MVDTKYFDSTVSVYQLEPDINQLYTETVESKYFVSTISYSRKKSEITVEQFVPEKITHF